jgi:hypothetical protein
VGKWRALPNPTTWQVIWLAEVAPTSGKAGNGSLDHLEYANHNANPAIMRLVLKLATGAGKTTVMLIAWQAVNAARRAPSKKFTRCFFDCQSRPDHPRPVAGASAKLSIT